MIRRTRSYSLVLALCALVLLQAPAWAGSDKPLSRQEEAAAVSIAAKGRADLGDYAIAAELYLQAARLDANERGYVYSAARCLHKAGKWAEAEKAYREFLEVAGPDHPLRAKAIAYRDEVQRIQADEAERARALAALKAEQRKLAEEREKLQRERSQAAAKPPVGVVAGGRRAESTGIGWGIAAAGVAAAAAGGWLVYQGLANAQDLATGLDTLQDGKVVGIDRAGAVDLRSRAIAEQWAGGALIGLGLAGAATGIWLATHPGAPAVAVLPAPGGATLAVRF